MILTRKKIIIGIILLAVLLVMKEIVAYFPYFIAGAPLGLFEINNMDSTDHNITIQVFDSTNKLLFNETYELGRSQTVSYPASGWKDDFEKGRLFPNGEYTFMITLDGGNDTQIYQEVDTWSSTLIDIYNKGNIQIVKMVV